MNHVPGIQLWMGNLWKEWKRLRDTPEKISKEQSDLISEKLIQLIQLMKEVQKLTG